MKKSLAYMAAAVLLGTATMLFPLVFLSPSQTFTETSYQPQTKPTPETYSNPSLLVTPPSLPDKAATDEATTGNVPKPNDTTVQEPEAAGGSTLAFLSSLPYAGVILASCFFIAFGVSQYYKRKTTD